MTITATAGSQQVSGTGTLTVKEAPPEGFTIPASSFTIAPGQSNSLTLACITPNGASCTLNTTIVGLPAGITVSPVPPFNVPSSGVTVTFSASSSIPNGQYPITFVGRDGNYQTTLDLTLIIQNGNYWLDSPYPHILTVRTGATGKVTVGTGFGSSGQTPNYSLNLSISGLPGGTTAKFPASILPGQSATVTITAASDAPVSHNNSVLVTATPTDGSFISSASFLLDIIPPPGQLAASRSDIVPTDGDIVSAVYDPVHQVVFGSNPMWNRVDVISPATKSIVASIRVPSPKALALSLDGTKVIVGTNTAQSYWIDTTTRQVVDVKRFPIGGGSTSEVHELSTGEYFVVALSNLARTAMVCTSDASSCNPLYPEAGSPSYIFVSANGTKALLVTGGSPVSTTVYDAASRTMQNTAQVNAIGIDPTGTYVAVLDGVNQSGLSLYDTQLVLQRNVIADGLLVGGSHGVFSLDGKTLFLSAWPQNSNGEWSTFSIDVASGTWIGVAPTLATWLQGNYLAEVPLAADNTGLVFGGISHGLAIDDAAFYNNAVLGSGPVPWLTVLTGPVGVSTQTTFGGTSYDYLPDVYFGGQLATASFTNGFLTVNVPAISTPGPVNIKMEFSNGSEGFQPWAFTYGPWLQVADGSGASSDGGAKAAIVGLGLGKDPAKVQVKVGGVSAQVTGITQMPVTTGYSPIYPFPTSIVRYVVPAGSPGVADITVTTSAGTATLKSGMRYSQIQDFSSSDTFAAVLFDRSRNKLFLSAGDHVDVFNLYSSTYEAPITPPTVNGNRSFAGLALTPDHTKLLIANQTDGSLAVVNPDSPGSTSAILVASPQVSPSCILGPISVAATNDNHAIVAMGALPASSCPGPSSLYRVDLSSTVSVPFQPQSCGIGPVYSSRNGDKVVLSPFAGLSCIFDVATQSALPFSSMSNTSVAISGDGTLASAAQFSTSWDIADSTGAIVAHSQLPDLLPTPYFLLTSAAMNDTGSLLYMANAASNDGTSSAFVDAIDVNHGDVRSRIRLSENIQNVTIPMAIDPTDSRIFLITDKGLTVVTTSGVPLSVGTISPSTGPAGTVVSVRGSGFQNGMTATFNGVSAVVNVINPQTAQITIPVLSSGMTKLVLTNPDGQNYTMEASFRVN